MPQCARIIGGAGTGKTSHLLELMTKAIEAGNYTPYQIGFVSFTRAARQEAAERAGKLFGVDAEDLIQMGWFKTLHAVCYRMLEIRAKTLLSDNAESKKWISEAIGCPIGAVEEDSDLSFFRGTGHADEVLRLWSTSRNMLIPFSQVWRRAYNSSSTMNGIPGMTRCKEIIDLYEIHKKLDGRMDFVDIMGRYAGYEFGFDGPRQVIPAGDVPEVPIWFLDECQDNSALTDAVARRLVSKSRWVYLVGDVFQSIYSFAGASSKHFMSWDIPKDKQRILQQTYRCPAPIVEMGERMIRRCADYFDRGIKPADHQGRVHDRNYRLSHWPEEIDAFGGQGDWLLIARTNYQARRLAKRLNENRIPWKPVSDALVSSPWGQSKKNRAIRALALLEEGAPITAEDWQFVVKFFPVGENFTRGTKKKWKEYKGPDFRATLDQLTEYGATPEFINKIKQRSWRWGVPFADRYIGALRKYGEGPIYDPVVRVGTIHSVKGAEADNVLLLSSTSKHVFKSSQYDRESLDEERRVSYVAVTRARKNLYIATESRQKYRMDLN